MSRSIASRASTCWWGGRRLGEVTTPLAADLRGGLARPGHHPRDEAGEHLGHQAVPPLARPVPQAVHRVPLVYEPGL